MVLSESTGLNLALSGFSNVLIEHATAMVDAEIGAGYSDLERRAIIMVEALHLTSGMDLAAIMTRGALIQQIEEEGLAAIHPEGFQGSTNVSAVQNMAARQGISSGEYSDIRGLCQHIFPFIENVLGLSVSEIWSSTGKSIFREMRPALQSMITGVPSEFPSVRTSVAAFLDQAAVSLIAEGTIAPSVEQEPNLEAATIHNETIRNRAVSDLLTLGASVPTRAVRAALRPVRTANITGVVIAPFEGDNLSGEGYVLMKLNDQDQLAMYRRLMGDHITTTTLNTNNDVHNQPNGPRHFATQFRRLFGAGE